MFFAPFQRLLNDFVFIRTREMSQKSPGCFLVNECSERTTVRGPPGVQFDYIVAVIDAALKGR
jgi:hypothetical protein